MADDAKISNFLIGIVLVGGLITIIMLMLANGAVKYDVNYDNSTFSTFDEKTAQIYSITANVSNQTNSITSQNSVFDIIGSLFSQGYVAIKTTFISIDLFTDMADEGVDSLNLGPASSIVQTMIITIVAIIIFIGIIAAAILKWGV